MRLGETSLVSNFGPARSFRPNAAVERNELLRRFRPRRESYDNPDKSSDSNRHDHDVCKLPRVVAIPPQELRSVVRNLKFREDASTFLQSDRDDRSRDHRRDFGPRVDAPPK